MDSPVPIRSQKLSNHLQIVESLLFIGKNPRSENQWKHCASITFSLQKSAGARLSDVTLGIASGQKLA